MADYYPLIARAIGGLSDRSPEMRTTVYDRARTALMGQLRSLDPPLPEATIEQERTALEAAIARIEREQAPAASAPPRAASPRPEAAPPLRRDPLPVREAPAPGATRTPSPPPRDRVPSEPARLRPEREAPSPVAVRPRPGPESEAQFQPSETRSSRPESKTPPHVAARPRLEPEAPRPSIALPSAVRDRPRPAEAPATRPAAPDMRRSALDAAGPAARRPAVALAGGEAAPAPPIAAPEPAPEPPATDFPEAEGAESYEAGESDEVIRPRIGTQAPLTLNPGRGRSLILSVVLVIVIGLIGALAWTLRDRPDELPRPSAAEVPARTEGAKIGERVGGPPAPAPAPGPAAPAPEAGVPRAEPNAIPMAVLYEEDRSNPQAPKTTGGRVTWRTDALNAGQGQPLDTAIRATIDVPEAGFSLSLVIRRNLDATLPASHTVELNFTTRPGDLSRVVRDIGLLQFRSDVGSRGTPVAGLPVPVRDNLFLIGLSNLPADLDRNMELLRGRNWIDLPVRMASGQRAIVSFEKGAPGEAVVAEAFRQWQQ